MDTYVLQHKDESESHDMFKNSFACQLLFMRHLAKNIAQEETKFGLRRYCPSKYTDSLFILLHLP